ncbi:MAG: PQQ-dependent sugar dehydrogenase, partial [Gammaproteobacteria bacterium]
MAAACRATRLVRVQRRASALLLACLASLAAPVRGVEGSAVHYFEIEVLARGLEHPWGLAFLPDGRMLVTERAGRLRVAGADGTLSAPLAGVPAASAVGQGGLLDVALHPDFAANQLVYLSLAAGAADSYGTEVWRGRFAGDRLDDVARVFRALPKEDGGRHFGS